MDIVQRVARMRELSRHARAEGLTTAFVPTMGYFHEGHLSLVRRARELAGRVVVSLFVNPTQFGPNEDLQSYPRAVHRDTELAKQEGVDVLFMPTEAELYPDGFRTYVSVEGLSGVLCGAHRPGHFRGVTTIVLKLLNIVRPHFVLFGQKDAQQAVVLRRMIRDLDLEVEPVVCPTVRERDGLAMSSRNVKLNPAERLAAVALHRALERARELHEGGERDAARLLAETRRVIEAEPLVKLQYAELVDAEDLAPVESIAGESLLALAAHVGETRLIDNALLGP